MIPSTGSGTLDGVLQIGIALAALTSILLLWRNYRGR
ncbi:hypothetical protein BKA19_2317 [Blastococcus saxobsidens]|uniref:LPXTG cell wall anchor domain-containing protein n=1 Tax=Blastococcus saxobsidens TaxID=138336 RepID=A0A4Q7Y6M3_9ACTN|nr:hypothetical protein BKA19_2317 [Blastococcus saxobsidens]